MFKYLLLLSFFVINTSTLFSFHIDSIVDHASKTSNNKNIAQKTIPNAESFFELSQPPFSEEFVATNPYYLMQVAQDTLNFLNSTKGQSNDCVVPRHFKKVLPREKIESTLKFIIATIKKDMHKNKFRILDPNFLNKNFHFIHWKADTSAAQNNGIRLSHGGEIRITSYAIFSVRGNTHKTTAFPCALYQAFDPKIALKFTKQQVLAGILEKPENKKRVRAVAWLSRDDFEDALMQGTIMVRLPDNKERVFVANISNNIDYDRKESDPRHQKRYWFFKESKNSNWTIEQFKKRLKNRQNVIFAGDIYNIGIGKIIAIKHPNPITHKNEIRLGVIADTGGAFVRNLYQLDLFAGIFNNRTELSSYLKNIPVKADAFILWH
ncbi:MAG: hypothetical protein US22_C0031G0004 [candidate division TM6 bacterium GW2011_GWF2_36_6]|nr:MAG: hypothetical protein US22_C0031G0004 [candidate division TM6 bacterium GW2011_GWF2_36_6]